MEISDAVDYAKRVAFSMSKDPEMESIAGRAAWRALRTYDPTLSVPLKRWIARLTKQGVWAYWRKLRCRPAKQLAEDPPCTEDSEELDISRVDWRILVEYYVEKHALDVMARRYDCRVKDVKRYIAVAVRRLQDAVRDRETGR